MAKAKKGQLKLPKRLMGVKVPKKTRKSLNTLLRSVPSSKATPLVGAVVGSLVTIMAERLEQPLRDLVESRLPANKRRSNDKTGNLAAQAQPSPAHH